MLKLVFHLRLDVHENFSLNKVSRDQELKLRDKISPDMFQAFICFLHSGQAKNLLRLKFFFFILCFKSLFMYFLQK